jgi:predicted small secreted protein
MIRILATVFALSVLSGCNTLEGVGKDVKEAGKAIEKAAK